MNFFVTAGRGTEIFAANEIKAVLFSFPSEAELGVEVEEDREKLENEHNSADGFIAVRDGKVLFKADTSISILERILRLKCVERAFVLITDYENKTQGKRGFLDMLMKELYSAQSYGTAKTVLKQLHSLLIQSKKHQGNIDPNGQITQTPFDGGSEPPQKVIKLDTDNDSQPEASSDLLQQDGNTSALSSNLVERGNIFKNDEIGFRMSVRCSGKSRKWIDIKKLSKDLSWRVSKASGWNVDLRNPAHEVCLHIGDGYVTAGIPLTRLPLSRRPYILDPGLRGPVAWIMIQLADIKPNDVILDPMCGKGTLLLEASSLKKDVTFIGVDSDLSQLKAAYHNMESVCFEKQIDLIHADGLCLPLKSMCVDGVMCDAPFNKNHLTSGSEDEFYTSFFMEIHRVLNRSGKFVLLTSTEISKKIIPTLQAFPTRERNSTSGPQQQKCQDTNKADSSDSCNDSRCLFRLESNHYMKLGETHGEILIMTKL